MPIGYLLDMLDRTMKVMDTPTSVHASTLGMG